MIRVKNKKAIRNLSDKSLKANGLRNLVAVIAIALTATLFTALFTIAGGMISSIESATMRMVGTRAHGGFKFLTVDQYETVKEDPEIKDISYNILCGVLSDEALKKEVTEVRWTEEKDAAWGFSSPTTGSLPEERLEVAADTGILDLLGVPHEIGATVPLSITNKYGTFTEEFTLCGFWEPDPVMPAHEIYISREYCDEIAPALTTPLYEGELDNYYTGSLNPSIWFDSSVDIEGQMLALVERCGFDPDLVNTGVNWGYATDSVDFTTVLLVAAVLLLVLWSGYLIIYNVFYISVSKDIRFYGLLKTIGTTGKQIAVMVRRQAFLLCIIGIPLGLLAGYLAGGLLMPVILSITSINSSDMTLSPDVRVFVGAAVFALLTVYISCIKPCRLAARVSPVEAVRFTGLESGGSLTEKSLKKGKGTDSRKVGEERKKRTGKNNINRNNTKKTRKVSPFSMAVSGLRRDKKKTRLVVISLMLSLIILNCTYTIVHGFDMDKYLEKQAVTDFCVKDFTIGNGYSLEKTLDGVKEDFAEALKEQPGVENAGAVYLKDLFHTLTETGRERTLSCIENYPEELPSPYADESVRMAKEENRIIADVYGLDEALWDKLILQNGKLDREKFESGDYILVNTYMMEREGTWEGEGYVPGDQVTIDFNNGRSKTYTVLALGDIPYPLGPEMSYFLSLNFILPAEEFVAQAEPEGALKYAFDVTEGAEETTEEWVKNYCDTVNTDLNYVSKISLAEEFQGSNRMFLIVGGALSFILGLIGILNFINAVITSMDARKRELAMLQSVGMTGHQLKTMLVGEGFLYALMAVLLSVTAGNVLSFFLTELVAGQIWYFSYHFTMVPILLCAPVLLAVAVLVPLASYHFLKKQSIVERLRETE